MSRFFFLAAAIAFASTLPACAASATGGEWNDETQGDVLPEQPEPAESAEEESTSSEENTTESESLGARSGLSPLCFWRDDTQMTLRLYGAQSLVAGGVLRPAHSLTPGCSNVPEYLVRCALAAGETVKTAAGDTYEGQFGLAPSWTVEKLPAEQQRVITACLVQHIAQEKDVSIGLEGPALEETFESDLSESIVGANLFVGGTVQVGAAAFNAYVCADNGAEQACGSSAEAALRERICGTSEKCGFTFVGACADVCEFDERGLVIGCSGDIGNSPIRMRLDAQAFTSLHGDVCQ